MMEGMYLDVATRDRVYDYSWSRHGNIQVMPVILKVLEFDNARPVERIYTDHRAGRETNFLYIKTRRSLDNFCLFHPYGFYYTYQHAIWRPKD